MMAATPTVILTIPVSGAGVLAEFEDGNGNPSPLVSVASTDDTQTLAVVGQPAGPVVLTFGSQSTAPIPVVEQLPLGHDLWSPIPVTPGAPCQLAVAFSGSAFNNATYQVFDGPSIASPLLNTFTVGEWGSSAGIVYGVNGGGQPQGWMPIGTVTPTGSVISILKTGPTGQSNFMWSDGLLTVIDGVMAAYDDADPAHCSHGGGGRKTGPGYYNGSAWFANGTGSTMVPTLPAAEVQAAILALPGFPAAGVSVTSGDNVHLNIQFQGPLANLPQPTLISSDPAVVVAHPIVGGTCPSISVNGGQPIPLLGWGWNVSQQGTVNGLPYAFHFSLPTSANPYAIKPGDTVTFSCPAGFFASAAGPCPALVNVPVVNRSGQAGLVATPDAPSTFLPGLNIEGDNPGSLVYKYNNLANRIAGPSGLTWDADWCPTSTQGPTFSTLLAALTPLAANMPGLYTVWWVGAVSELSLIGEQTTVAEVVAYNITSSTLNRRVFDLRPVAPNVSPSFSLQWSSSSPGSSAGTYLQDATDIRVYPPDPSDPSGMTPMGLDPENPPPTFHANLTGRMLKDLAVLRFMDPLMTNNSSVTEFDQLSPVSQFGYNGNFAIPTIPVASITGYSGNCPVFDLTSVVVALVMTKIPHGFKSGMLVVYEGIATITLSGGATISAGNIGSNVWVLSPTTFLIVIQDAGGPQTMVNTITTGSVATTISGGSGMPYEDQIGLCNAVPSTRAFHPCIPYCMSPGGSARMATLAAMSLRPGVKVYVEYSNEPWNPGFWNYHALCAETRARGLGGFNDWVPAYVEMAAFHHDIWADVFAAFGREGDVVRVFGSQGTYAAASSVPMAEFAAANGYEIGMIVTAPYIVCQPNETSLAAMYAELTTDQMIDMVEYTLWHSGLIESCITPHYSALEPYFPDATVGWYEGGWDTLYPQPNPLDYVPRAWLNQRLVRHPRMFGVTGGLMSKAQALGCVSGTFYCLQAGLDPHVWSIWSAWDQLPGTGNPALDPLNLLDPSATVGQKSEYGGALCRWGSLVKP